MISHGATRRGWESERNGGKVNGYMMISHRREKGEDR